MQTMKIRDLPNFKVLSARVRSDHRQGAVPQAFDGKVMAIKHPQSSHLHHASHGLAEQCSAIHGDTTTNSQAWTGKSHPQI